MQLEPVSNKWIFGGIFELARVEQNVEVHFLSKKDRTWKVKTWLDFCVNYRKEWEISAMNQYYQ